MRFLLDAQLPPRLAPWLIARGHDARHVVDLPDGLRMADTDVRHHAAMAGEVIVTKDKDFLDLAAVRGTPPIVLLIAIGNASTRALLAALDAAWPQLELELARDDAGVVALERGRLSVLRRH